MLSVINSKEVQKIKGIWEAKGGTGEMGWWLDGLEETDVSGVLKEGEESDGLGQNDGHMDVKVRGILELRWELG